MRAALSGFGLGRRLRNLASLTCGGFLLLSTPVIGADWNSLSTKLLQPVAFESQIPNSSIPMALASDGQGFLWVGTQNGLARWDGQQFRLFGSGKTADTLPDSQIETLHVDHTGRMWIGTLSAGLACYDARAGTFKRYAAGGRGQSYAGVHALADATNGRLWVGAESGLDELDPASGRVTHVVAGGPLQAVLTSGVNALVSGSGDLWIGTNKGLLRRDARTGAVSLVKLAGGAPSSIKALLLDSVGRLWVGSEGSGAFRVDPATGEARPVPGSVRAGPVGTSMRVRALLEISPEDIWLGTYDDGVLAVDPTTLRSRRVRLGDGNLLYGDQGIRALHRAPDGEVFIAANSAITRYDPRHPAFEVLMGGEAPTAVLAERTPVSLGQDGKGRAWIGFISHGVDIVDPKTGGVVHAGPRPGGLPEAAVRQIVPDHGGMLVATDSGLYQTGGNGRQAHRLAQPGRAPDAAVVALLRDGGRLWLGGRDGLWVYGFGSDDQLSTDQVLPAGQLSDRRIQDLTLDPRGAVWIGTARGLNVFDPKSRRLTSVEPGPRDTATPTGFISSIFFDRRGRLWVTTFGHGISVAESTEAAEAHRFHRIDVAEGLPNSNADMVLEDAQGAIWASTDSGLARIDPDSLRVQVLQLAQGVPISSFFNNAGLKSATDDLLFGGVGGLEIVHPRRYNPTYRTPPLRITEVREHGRVLPGDPFQALAPGAALHLPPSGGGLEVGFAALDYGAPGRVRYAYRLLGASSAWAEVDVNRRLVSFNSLAPGRYTLEIRASDSYGDWRPQVLRLPIVVAPAWDQSLWFHLGEVLVGLGVVLLLVLWRTDHLNRRRRELEQMVEERTYELQDQKHELQTRKDALERQAIELAEARTRAETLAQAKSDFLANMSHEIRTPLNGVVAVADVLARSDLPSRERDMAELIRASGDTLQRLLSDILDMARIESGKITVEIAPFHVGDMVRAVADLSQLRCDEKGIGLQVEIGPDLDEVVTGDMVRVRQVITNLLSNAVKFTDRGEVRMLAERLADGWVRFTVSDTGVGFSMDDKVKVLSRFGQADSSITRRFGGTGLGLSICCNLAALMGGVLDCDSEPGVGSRFWIELPLEPASQGLVPEHALKAGSDSNEGAPLRLLVADDHPTNRQVVKLMLDDVAELTFVEDGAQAVEAFERGAYDAILMDMQMPVMDGLTALGQIRRREQDMGLARTPAIMLTANALPEHVASACAAGADLHLAKPFTASDLFKAIEEALFSPSREQVAA